MTLDQQRVIIDYGLRLMLELTPEQLSSLEPWMTHEMVQAVREDHVGATAYSPVNDDGCDVAMVYVRDPEGKLRVKGS